MEVGSDLAAPHFLQLLGPEARVERPLPPAHALDELPDLLGRCHAREQGVDVDAREGLARLWSLRAQRHGGRQHQ